MDFTLTTLGVSSASPMSDRYPSAHVLDVHGRLFLLDCGEGTQILMARNGISHFKISDICISHLHGDHIFGLFGLLSTMSLKGRTAPVNIYAPAGMEAILTFFKEQFGDGLMFEVRHIRTDSKEKTLVMETDDMEMYSFPMKHTLPCWGFLFKEKEPARNINKAAVSELKLTVPEILELKAGRDVTREDGSTLRVNALTYQPSKPKSFAYCCDTAPFSRECEYIADVDLLLHETTYGADMDVAAAQRGHSTTVQAASAALKAGVKKMVITHFSSRYHHPEVLLDEVKEIFENAFLAGEGIKFEI